MNDNEKLIVILEDVILAGLSNVIFRKGEIITGQPNHGSWQVIEPERFNWLTFAPGKVSPGYTLREAAAYLSKKLDIGPIHAYNVAEWVRNGLFPHAVQQTGVKGRGGKRWIVPLVDLETFTRPGAPRKTNRKEHHEQK